MPRDLSGSWDSPGQTRRGEEGGDGPQVGTKNKKGWSCSKKDHVVGYHWQGKGEYQNKTSKLSSHYNFELSV